MLHEILLSLSGHPSALFDAENADGHLNPKSFPLLSHPEAELLSGLRRLAQLHRLLRAHASQISSTHPSTICRAVATAISSIHLARFQQKILEVEAGILKKDAKYVGAYNIVPLATVVTEFEDWTRLMEWLWDLARFIMRPHGQHNTTAPTFDAKGISTGAGIIDKLRLETQTGFPEIEEAAVELGKVAETTWLRQLSSWILYGRLPAFSVADFFIQAEEVSEQGFPEFRIESKLLPKFVSQRTASSILFIGKSLNHIYTQKRLPESQGLQSTRASELDLLPTHLKYLSKVQMPISSATLAEAISNIRFSLSRNLLHHLLPLPKIAESLKVLQDFFLLGRGEFAVALISEAERWRQVRLKKPLQGSQRDGGLRNMLIREGELTTVMNRAWSSLANLDDDEDGGDSTLELGRDIVHLVIPPASEDRPGTPGRAKERSEGFPKISTVVFNDLLLSVPIKLAMDLRSPIDLFISPSELELYSAINAYLLAVRRAHWRLTGLWKQSTLRRDHPAPPLGNSSIGRRLANTRRERTLARGLEMRKVWATCGAAVFLLSESGAYFEGEVVSESCKHFRSWVLGNRDRAGDKEDGFRRPGSPGGGGAADASSSPQGSTKAPESHDPETLASAHRSFLSAIAHALLLTDMSFTRALRSFFANVDQLIAFIYRLQSIQTNLDLEEDEGVVDALASYADEEREVALQLDRARKKVDSDMKALVGRLRELDNERSGSGPLASASVYPSEREAFEPWREGGVDRLLMKLDFGRLAAGEDAEGSDDGL